MKINGLDIKRYRQKEDITQTEMAELIGVSLRTIQNYENGEKIPKSKNDILSRVLEDKKHTSRYDSTSTFKSDPSTPAAKPRASFSKDEYQELVRLLDAIESDDNLRIMSRIKSITSIMYSELNHLQRIETVLREVVTDFGVSLDKPG